MSVDSVSSSRNHEVNREYKNEEIKRASSAEKHEAAKRTEETHSSYAKNDESEISSTASQVTFSGSSVKVASLDDEVPAASASSASKAAGESSETSQSAFKMTSADKYEDGSDVKELAYDLAQQRDREDVDLSKYTVLQANGGSNNIEITKGKDGGIIVSVDGEEKSFTAAEAQYLIIDGGAGDDSIIADEDLGTALHIVGGEGSDTIKGGRSADFIVDNYGANTIYGRSGDDKIIANGLDLDENTAARNVELEDNRSFFSKLLDKITGKKNENSVSVQGNYIDGGDGADYIEGGMAADHIIGGNGNDTIYGLDGNDIIDAGDGRDYIDGGNGGDNINAGAGNDMIFGGNGNDTINGVSGNNVIVGGRGEDTVNAGAGNNRITTDGSDTIVSGDSDAIETVVPMDIPGNITVAGNDAGYKARVISDLEALAAISVGQSMLSGLGSTGHNVKIASTDGGNYCSYNTNGVLKDDGTANIGSDSTVAYNRFRTQLSNSDWGERSPIVGMYHEMAHAYDAGNGILDARMYNYDGTLAKDGEGEVKGAELQAVGIDTGSKDINLNPEGISENALRAFLGLANRDRY